MVITEPKTETSKAPVPVVGPLKTALQAWKAAQSVVSAGAWMFPASFVRAEHPTGVVDSLRQTPINPGNFVRDQVAPVFEKAGVTWRGFHAFRRGLSTNLHAMGVQDIDIQQILRHSDVSVTRKSYIKKVSTTARNTMDRFEGAWAQQIAQGGLPN
jgi:integrase